MRKALRAVIQKYIMCVQIYVRELHLLCVVESVGLLYRHLGHGHLQLLLHLLLQLLRLQLLERDG